MNDEASHRAFPANHVDPTANPLAGLLRLDDRRDSLVAAISEWVGRGIIEGRLRPGDDLNSVELARRFNTSRTPVREALMLLEKEGLVEIRARRRPRVAHATLDVVREIYAIRANLHGLVAERVASFADERSVAELRALVETMGAAADEDDVDRYFWANVAFHERAAEAADNPTLQRILDSLGLRVLQLRHRSMSLPNRMHQSIEDHRRLVRAFEERDALLANALARSIVLGALVALELAWSDAPDAPDAPDGHADTALDSSRPAR
ncbi:MAG: GntR family transcriptional regulator [Solirubrobacteraceae bacterium]